MAIIGLVCADSEDSRKLALIAGENGHLVHGAARLQDAVEILRERRPRLMLVVDGPDQDASVVVREVLRAAPLMPVVVALKDRDSSRAVGLMRAGAAEVVPPPWTRESLHACLSKGLRLQGTSLSVVKAPPRRAAPVYAAVVGLFLAACFGVAAHRRALRLEAEAASLAKITSWELPYRHPASMTFADGKLYVADWFTQSVYVHDPNSKAVERVVHFPAETPVALTMSADAAWSATASGYIVRHLKDDKLTQVERAAAPRTFGLAFDGLYLWSADGDKSAIRKRLPDAQLSVMSSYPYPGLKAAALVWDGHDLWSLDAGNRELVKHNLERPDEAVTRLALAEYKDGDYKPVALGFDGARFWTVGERVPQGSGPARLFRHGGPR